MNLEKELIKGSAVLLVSFGIYNLFNFLFQSSMARLLSLSEFGILAFLYNIVYVLSGFSETIQITIAKFASNENNPGKIKNILKRGLKKSFLISLFLFFAYLVCAIAISYFSRVSYFLVAFTGLITFSIFLVPINRGILQGKKKFKSLGLNMICESLTKFSLAVLFVYFGWSVFGAVFATLIAGGIAFFLTFFSLKEFIKGNEETGETNEIYSYSKSSFFVVISILIFYSFDVVAAKVIFSPETAGVYAIASLMAKSIFFGTQPISKAMFPISSLNENRERKSKNVFWNALVVVVLLDLVALFIFYFYPDFVIKLFSGKIIPEASQILFYLGVANSLLSVTNLVLLHRLSNGRIMNYKSLLMVALVLIAIVFFYAYKSEQSLQRFTAVILLSSAIFLMISLILKKN